MRLVNRKRILALISLGGILAVILVCLFIPFSRNASVQFLNSFFNLKLEADNYKVYPTSDNTGDFYGRAYAKIRSSPIKQAQASSAEEASQLVGFKVFFPAYLPEGMQPVTQTQVTTAHTYQVELNAVEAQDLLQAKGFSIDFLPQLQDRLKFAVAVGPGAQMQQFRGPNWFTLIEGKKPEINLQERIDPAQLSELGVAGLRYLGLPMPQARILNESLGWAFFIVLPPTSLDMAGPALVNGNPAMLLHGTASGNDLSALIWEDGGLLYGIYGNLNEEDLVAMGESLGKIPREALNETPSLSP